MVLGSGFRRSRFSLLFASLTVLTTLVYALLNVLIDTSDHNYKQKQQWQKEQRGTTSGGRYSNISIANRSSSSTRCPHVSIASLKLRSKFTVQETTESLDNSNNENAADDDGQADTGTEQEGVVITQRSVEQHVRRDVTRLHLRPPKSVKYSHGQWQVVGISRHLLCFLRLQARHRLAASAYHCIGCVRCSPVRVVLFTVVPLTATA